MYSIVTTVLRAVLLRSLWIVNRMYDALCEGEPVRLDRSVRGKRVYFYRVEYKVGEKKRTYLGKADSEQVRRIAADEIRRARIGILENNIKKIRECLDGLQDDSVEAVLAKVKHVYRDITEECYLDERMEELKRWAKEPYVKNPADFPEEEHLAIDGTRVRSKGEVIWYNILYMLGIPFRYDCRITVVDKWGRKHYEYPDFLIQCYDGTFIIIEHFGKLWNDDYLKRQGEKIQNYLRMRYVLGVNFFVTSDDAAGGTNSEAIERLARVVQERFYGDGIPA